MKSNHDHDTLSQVKQEYRTIAAKQRNALALQDEQQNYRAGQAITEYFIDSFTENLHDKIIAGYAAMRSELSLWALLRVLDSQNVPIGLPIVTQKASPLTFHGWQADDTLITGTYGELTPSTDKAIITPDIILAPLLAYSDAGVRLGYGGGYYDRTLAKMQLAGKKPVYIGVAYQGQKMDNLPCDTHDFKLDAILTEKGLDYFD